MDDNDPITAGTLIGLIREYGGTLPGDLEASDPLDDFEGHFAPEARDDIQETLQARQDRREKMRTEAAARREARRTSVWDDVIDCPAAAEKPEPDASAAAEKPEPDASAAAEKPEPDASAAAEKPEPDANNEKDLQNQYVDKPSDTADTWDDIIDNPDTDIDDSPKTLRSLQAQVARLTPGVDHKDVTTILRRIAGTSQVHRLVLIRDFCRNTGIPRGDVKAVLSSIGRNRENQTIVDDVPLLLSTLVRKTHYKGGKWLLRTRGLWYRYTGINWEPVEDDLIDQNILKTIVKWRKASKDDDVSISSLMSPTERILRARQAIDGDPFQLGKVPRAIINVKNGELHVSPDGEVTLKPHSYSSYLLSGLKNVEYEPGAQCKRMDKALLQIFANDPDKEATIRHFWEIAGYCIQPKKNIPAWFLLQGSGSNGKSVLMRVLSELLGDAAVQMAIHEFGAPHALSVLPGKLGLIDDDVKRGVILPDDFMKKISENKPLYANPKKEKYFPFVSSLTPILASNHWPKIVDLSEGMVRRAYVIPFSRRFPPSKQNLDLAQIIVDKELNGVLIRALEGLRRLRQRGSFQPSPACLGAKRAWLYGANTTAAFMQDCIKRCAGARTPLSEIHDRYVDWCEDQELELKYRLTKRTLGEHFVSMGFTRSKSPDGAHRCLSDIELKEKEND
jgi:putative DNA primase/helicase